MRDVLEKILAEADALIRDRLEEKGLAAPHLVVAVTSDGEIILRSNVSADVLRSFGRDLNDVADEIEGKTDGLRGTPMPTTKGSGSKH